jgi:type VI secretion system secreted protein VgrG
MTDTPLFTTTPFIPPAIKRYSKVLSPKPQCSIQSIQLNNCSSFTDFIPATVFQNPIRYMCGVFSYAEMVPGSQWTALWLRDRELVHYETIPWDGETGGYGFTEWEAPPEEFLPGNYEVQIFVGLEWKVVGQFILQGDAPTAAPTLTPTFAPTPPLSSPTTGTRTP